jgi:hypothetical protein
MGYALRANPSYDLLIFSKKRPLACLTRKVMGYALRANPSYDLLACLTRKVMGYALRANPSYDLLAEPNPLSLA